MMNFMLGLSCHNKKRIEGQRQILGIQEVGDAGERCLCSQVTWLLSPSPGEAPPPLWVSHPPEVRGLLSGDSSRFTLTYFSHGKICSPKRSGTHEMIERPWHSEPEYITKPVLC